ncbi:hypothetical protein A8B78_10310 [Jannaschia sp. EhC01]|nr:hypothetical protein A8B78_10310 [Jannaschia sp. EhC01]
MGAAFGPMIPVSALLSNISNEVERLAQVAEGLDEFVGDLAVSNVDDAVPHATRLQEMDALRQALHAIARVTATAARDIPQATDAWLDKGALAEGVTLEKIRDACLHMDQVTSAATIKETNGDDEPTFFDEF